MSVIYYGSEVREDDAVHTWTFLLLLSHGGTVSNFHFKNHLVCEHVCACAHVCIPPDNENWGFKIRPKDLPVTSFQVMPVMRP